MYTANTMNCPTEALGLASSGKRHHSAVYADRRRLAYKAGLTAVELFKTGRQPDKFLSPSAIRNALRVDMALWIDQYHFASSGHRPKPVMS